MMKVLSCVFSVLTFLTLHAHATENAKIVGERECDIFISIDEDSRRFVGEEKVKIPLVSLGEAGRDVSVAESKKMDLKEVLTDEDGKETPGKDSIAVLFTSSIGLTKRPVNGKEKLVAQAIINLPVDDTTSVIASAFVNDLKSPVSTTAEVGYIKIKNKEMFYTVSLECK